MEPARSPVTATGLVIAVDDPLAPDVAALVEHHLAAAASLSPPEHVHALDTGGLLDPALTVFSARHDGVLLGIGALKQLGPTHGELKSMHTIVSARGRGIGRAMVEHLLAVAAERGYERVSLETGTMEGFAAARRLYARVGFEPCPPFGPYTDNPFSTCMTIEPSAAGAHPAATPRVMDEHEAEQQPARFRELAAAAVDELLGLRPEWATMLGDHRFDDRIDDLSPAGVEASLRALRQRRAELATIEVRALGREDRVDHAMLDLELERLEFELAELGVLTWDPLAYNIGEAFQYLLTREVLPLAARLRGIAARLEQVPARLADARRQLEAPPRVHLETALAQHPGTVAMVGEEVDRLLAAEPSLRGLVEPAQRRALDALAGYASFLEEALDGPHRDPRIGPELFARRLALALASPLGPEELLARAERRIEEVTAELAELAGSAGSEGIRAALDRAAADAPDDDTIVAAAGEALTR